MESGNVCLSTYDEMYGDNGDNENEIIKQQHPPQHLENSPRTTVGLPFSRTDITCLFHQSVWVSNRLWLVKSQFLFLQ